MRVIVSEGMICGNWFSSDHGLGAFGAFGSIPQAGLFQAAAGGGEAR